MELSPFHSEKLVRVISSWPDASPLWKRFVSNKLVRQITRISDPMQVSSDVNLTVKGSVFVSMLGGAAYAGGLVWFPKRPSPSFLSESLLLFVNRAGVSNSRVLFVYVIYISSELFSGFATMTSQVNHGRSRCATTWLQPRHLAVNPLRISLVRRRPD